MENFSSLTKEKSLNLPEIKDYPVDKHRDCFMINMYEFEYLNKLIKNEILLDHYCGFVFGRLGSCRGGASALSCWMKPEEIPR